ncbi:PEP-CTERM sorting domain-containing protein [Nitrosomonas sp.]|uniref:PEP-CTERM sorting domain-containing protein n=1 Tax=Nitrosomonas sp. TaxID=42353 RepID=UPI0025EB3AEC|nr:PEP-CTERM sorting domain-containing protein [Nitrosomonas sp.]
MKKKLIAASIASVLSIGLASNSAAETITFDGLAGNYMPGEYSHDSASTVLINSAVASIGGFQFASSGVGLNPSIGADNGLIFVDMQNWGSNPGLSGAAIDTFLTAWNGTDYAMFSPSLTFNLASNEPFSLNGLDLVMWQAGYGETQATITGNFVGGGSISQSVGLDATALNSDIQIGNDFTHHDLTGFTNLASVTITKDTTNFLAIDNINVTLPPVFIPDPDPVSPVPEPSTYAMLLAGLGLVGFMVRRRNRQQ